MISKKGVAVLVLFCSFLPQLPMQVLLDNIFRFKFVGWATCFLFLVGISLNLNAQQDSPYQKARNYSFEGKYDSCLAICDSFLTQQPDNYDFEVLRARVLSWDKQFEKSEEQCRELNQKYPDSKEVYILWATVNRWMQENKEAVRIWEEALSKFPQDSVLMYNLANEYGNVERFEEGYVLVDSLLDSNWLVLPSYQTRLILLLKEERFDSAYVLCDSLIHQYPNNIDLRMLRAQGRAWNELLDSARQELDTIFKLDSTTLNAHHLRTNTYLWESKNDSAVWSADTGLHYHPTDLVLKVMMAKAYARMDSFSLCDSIIDTVLAEDSLNYDAWNVGLNSRLAQEDFDSVITATENLDTIYPKDEELTRMRVLALAGNEEYKDAIELMGEPDEVDSLDENSKILYTKLHYWDGKNSKSLKLADRYLEQHTQSVGLLYTKAIIQKSRFEKKHALVTVDSALAIDSTNQDLQDLRKEIEDIYLNELGGWLTYDFYSNSTDPSMDRKAFQLEYLRRIQRHVFLARLTVANRFDSTGIQGEIDAYPTITDWLYVYCNIGASNRWLFPEFRAGIEPFVSLPYTLELSLGVRYMQYPTNSVLIYTGSISAYPGQWYLSFRPYITFTNNGVNQSYNGKVRRFFKDPKSYLELSGGFGSSPDNAYLDQAFDQLVESRSWNIGLTYQQRLGKQFYGKAFVIFDQYYPDQIPDFNIVSCNLGLWWMF